MSVDCFYILQKLPSLRCAVILNSRQKQIMYKAILLSTASMVLVSSNILQRRYLCFTIVNQISHSFVDEVFERG